MNYKETNVNGSSYVRANQVLITNQRGVVPVLSFTEEKVLTLDNETFMKPYGQINEEFTPENAGTLFPLINTETGVELGQSMTYADVYAILHSLYIHLAQARDIANGITQPE